MRTDQVKAVSWKGKVQRRHERARLQFTRDQCVAADADALTGNNRVDRVQLLPEIQMLHFAGIGNITPFLSGDGKPM